MKVPHRPRVELSADTRWLVACGLLIGLGAGLLWAGGILARAIESDPFDVFAEDDELMLPDPSTYDAPPWIRGDGRAAIGVAPALLRR